MGNPRCADQLKLPESTDWRGGGRPKCCASGAGNEGTPTPRTTSTCTCYPAGATVIAWEVRFENVRLIMPVECTQGEIQHPPWRPAELLEVVAREGRPV